MNGRKAQIGFSQRIRLEWFEQTADLVLAGNDKVAINDALQALLQDKVSVGGQAVRGNREKVITILLKTWFTVPGGLEKLRDVGLDIIQVSPRKDRLAVHWGMVLASRLAGWPVTGSVVAIHSCTLASGASKSSPVGLKSSSSGSVSGRSDSGTSPTLPSSR